MRISAIQFAVKLGDPDFNYAAAERLIRKAAEQGTDSIVLPELWNTSFYPPNVEALADTDGERTKPFLENLAKTYGINIVGGSVANKRNGKLYNTTFIVDRKGTVVSSYDKVHLFTPGKEEKVFTAGNAVNVFSLDEVQMASVICYDIRFCEWVRKAALSGIQLLFVPAAWPYPRLNHWQILNQARAIENQLFIAAVNSCGTAGTLKFCGHTMLIDPWGKIIAQGEDEERIVAADLDFSVIKSIRDKINVFHDRRPELYNIE